MADFPTLTPTIRPLAPGRWGGATLAAMNGQTSMVRRSSAEIGRRVQLRFENITEAQFLQIVDHYRNQRSGLDGFNFNSATLPTAYTPSGHTWLYAGPPEVVDHHADVFTVAIECRSEPRGPFRVSGGAFTIQPALTAGTITPIVPGLAITPVESLTAGTITPIVAGAALAPPGAGDPDCSLLLSFSGANDSTDFVDSSGKGLVTSHVVGAKISTAQSKFGGSSGLFAPTSYIRYTPQAGLQMTGDFTIEAQLYPLSTADMMAASGSSDSNTQIFRLNEGGSGRLSFYLNGLQVFSPTAAGITANTWQHVSICRSGSSTRMFVNGTQVGSTNTTWTGSFRIDVIGAFFVNGSAYPLGSYFNGHIDELIVLKRAIRTANFTAPASPYDGASSASFTPGSVTGIVAGAGYSSISPSLAPGAPV